ncbi:helix-turn-helix domain-containing protein [Microbacterium lacticum]|uniref:helix-turn-helix domain-containing protein n=1 Tax=Microbacterium lacticum TaxID=33885 RepID=UPI0028D1F0AD|nr:helix-turn-helix domain-containing protein [Microbacterium lacticum]
MPDDLDIPAAAALAGRHPNTIRTWVRSGLLPAYRVGPRDIRIRRDDLDAVLNRPVTP